MAIVKKAQYRGQAKTDTLDGGIRIEEGNNRIVGRDPDNKMRLLLGPHPEGLPWALTITSEGYDVTELFT